MAIDRKLLADKIKKYREQFQVSINELSKSTGILEVRLTAFEKGEAIPDGDEILILADFYKCDFKFFISNETVAAFEQTEYLFRQFGDDISKQDRWAIQEVLFLSECEAFLFKEMNLIDQFKEFNFTKTGNYYKNQGAKAALSLRSLLGYSKYEVPLNIYEDFRKIGLHVFRRKFENSNISGIFIKHPWAGKCVLVNYSEDVYRQRFTVAHEVGHSILDDENDVVVSFNDKWTSKHLSEIRANVFANNYLLPPEFLRAIPDSDRWDKSRAIEWANKLKVSTEAFAYALVGIGLINKEMEQIIKYTKVPSNLKHDPELSGLSKLGRDRKKMLLERGLSSAYVRLCFNAYRTNLITSSRMAEMLLATEAELIDITSIYGECLQYD